MNVNIHPTAWRVYAHDHVHVRASEMDADSFFAGIGEGVAISITTIAEADRFVAVALEAREAIVAVLMDRLNVAERRALELCPASFNGSRRDRLVSIAEDAARSGDDVDGAIHEGITMLSAPPVCAGQAPGAAR